MEPISNQKPVVIGKTRIDFETNTIQSHKMNKKVEPLLLRLFLILYSANGKIVSKKEILDYVWKDTIVTEDSITKAISKLRLALKNEQKYVSIETIRGKGYRVSIQKPGFVWTNRQQKLFLLAIIGLLLYFIFGSGLIGWIIELGNHIKEG